MSAPGSEPAAGAIAPERALALLAGASEALASSLDLEDTLRRAVRFFVPAAADWCKVDLLADDGSLRTISSGHPDPEQERLLEELRDRYRAHHGEDAGAMGVIRTGEPELREDIAAAPSEVALRPEEADLYERLAPRSYLIVPLVVRDQRIGALTWMSTTEGRHYGEADLAVAAQLARRVALAVDNARLFDESERALAMLDAYLSAAPVGLAFWDAAGRCTRINEALTAMSGLPASEHIGRLAGEHLGDNAGDAAALVAEVLATGRPAAGIQLTGSSALYPGEQRLFEVTYSPVRAGGETIGVAAVVLDVSEREELLERERAARRRATFLVDAGAILDASMDYEETLGNVARIAVPGIADWCAIQLVDGQGRLQQVAVGHVDPERIELAWKMHRRFPPDPGDEHGSYGVLRSGIAELTADIPDELLAQAISDPEHYALLRDLGLRSSLLAPMVARGRTMGVLVLVNAESERTFGAEDLQLAEELARRAAIAVDNARLYTERSRIAHVLQVRMLPGRLPEIPGLELAARYRAAGEHNEVGGDFYDAFARRDGSWALFIGDVSGKGPEAASVTTLARYTLRAASLGAAEPSQALALLNEAMLSHDDTNEFCTTCLAHVTPGPGSATVRLALGGHPAPLLLTAGGEVSPQGRFGTLVGLAPDAAFHDHVVQMAPGDALVFYTDGVSEAGSAGAELGQEGIVDTLASLRGSDPAHILSVLEEVAVAAQRGEPRDDIALMALRVAPARGTAPAAG